MSKNAPLSAREIANQLDRYLEVEFSFLKTDQISVEVAQLPPEQQEFILQWVRRVASINIQLAYEFAARADQALEQLKPELIERWCLLAMDTYDRAGLQPAMSVIRDLQGFYTIGHRRQFAALFEDTQPVLLPFVQGLSGRRLKLEQDVAAWTDGEVIYMPEMVVELELPEDNFQLSKAMVVHLWAQTRFGTLNLDPERAFAPFGDLAKAQQWFHALETVRLDAHIAREFPGLYREMMRLKGMLSDRDWVRKFPQIDHDLQRPEATAADSVKWLAQIYEFPPPEAQCYQGGLDLQRAWQARQQRLLRDEARFRDALRVMAEEIAEGRDDHKPPARFDLNKGAERDDSAMPQMELVYLDQLMPVPDHVNELLNSILLDLTEVPEEYLVPAGPGEYDPALLRDAGLSPEDAWSGTYHEEGAFFYDEWDFARQHYRKYWCVLREVEVTPAEDDFYGQTLAKYKGHIKSLHRTFEVLRGEDKMLRRQVNGDDVDIDAYVEALGDMRSGLEMSDRLFTRMHRDDRNLAAVFMVDMSGSTKGWINQAEREALILLVEALEILGDRYAIYGFSGWARKRCEVYRIKDFDQPMGEEVKRAISGIEAKDYTRMGAPIRHFTRMLKEVEARVKLLVTLSDGKPDDYDHYYRGEYGIEDTRQSLFEARISGIHPFCITIDKEGAEYLPHMYGRANYVVLDDVAKLPLKVSDIYRKITT